MVLQENVCIWREGEREREREREGKGKGEGGRIEEWIQQETYSASLDSLFFFFLGL